ncbi:hydrogenase nickel incorporation protein HypB [Orenia marismortui]|uniref:Hydrogenase nickel incorporation protein HypB n=1 Tax=Orenia marismortui TaxID=46469 RepID=A0A4R8H9T1_9FIRM|nr:hydrogenase nickel incorporation protein HypB [Orenia marismortui]TDX52398.1 hydrogenase nickel incorporation protein HypB [Orenia marismortui]
MRQLDVKKEIGVMKDLFATNNKIAASNRQLFKEKGVFTINLVGSPGAGKTSLLEKIIGNMKDELNIVVIEGDLYTTKDAERIEQDGVEVIQLNTKGACHLEANMIAEAISDLDLAEIDLLIIENVGNLVCTASFDLGEDIKITLLSITEGSDKPLKYPVIFQNSEAVVVNKLDLLNYTDFSMDELYGDLKALKEDIKVFEVSCVKEKGILDFEDYLKDEFNSKRLAIGI